MAAVPDEYSVLQPLVRQPSRWLAPCAGLLMLIGGTAGSQMVSLMNKQIAPIEDGGVPQHVQAPFFQTWIMYWGGVVIFPFFLLDRRCSGKSKSLAMSLGLSEEPTNKQHCRPWLWVIPTAFDFIATISSNYSLVFLSPAIARMLMAFNVLLTFALRTMWLRFIPKVYEIAGVAVVTIGMVLASVSALTGGQPASNHNGFQWIGILLTLNTAIFSTLHFVVEERLFISYSSSALETASYMGIFGLLMGSVLLICGQLIGFEKSSSLFYQMGEGSEASDLIILTCLLYFIAMAIFNIASIVVIRAGSSVLRGVVNTARTVALWALQLMLGARFDWWSCSAMISIVIGVTIYHYNFYVEERKGRFDEFMRREVECRLIGCPNREGREEERERSTED